MIPRPCQPSSRSRARGLCLLAMLGAGCVLPEPTPSDDTSSATGADGSPTSTGADGSPTSTGIDDPSTTTPPVTDDGTATDGATSDTDEPPLVQCPAGDESVSAAFSVTIDDTPIVIDYSVFHSPPPNAPAEWDLWGSDPEIDGPCDVVSHDPDALTLTCLDIGGVMRTFALQLSGSEIMAMDVGLGPVHLWYQVNEDSDELEANPDSSGHAFVVSSDTGIVVAGVDGRYSVYSSFPLAWPDWPSASVGDEPCDGVNAYGMRTLARVSLENGAWIQTYDRSAKDLGFYRLLVEISATDFADDPSGEEVDVQTARMLLGLPPI